MAHLQLESYPNLSLKSGTSSTGIRTSFLMERVAHHQLVYPDKVETFVHQHPNWVYFLKIIAEHQYIELEKRIFQLQKSDAAKRYSDLMKNQPEYIQKIPLQYLASYLGITQRHLSRIRKEFVF